MMPLFNRVAALTLLALSLLAVPALAMDDTSREDLVEGSAGEALYGERQLETLPDAGELVFDYEMDGSILDAPYRDEVRLAFRRVADEEGEGTHFTFDISLFPKTRVLNLPTVTAESINPIFLVFFQRDANMMSRNTGGSVHYFRNAVRTTLNQPGEVRDVEVAAGDKDAVDATQVRFTPFGDAVEDRRMAAFAQKAYTITVSDDVPGGVVELTNVVPEDDGSGVKLRETYRFRELIE
ncbi:hypothetical protein [Pararhizobium haloflavum]|uniref:hypothetical protein n=1 Tax=Pararhizobium haloflavum TaxID=2037914 RepID=UPI000C19AEC7|nr:hypothetical protein [Pararhizobium haloflavum]